MAPRLFRSIVPLVTILAGLTFPFGASAHPHVWIDTQTTVQFDQDQRIDVIKVRWLFDDIYSAYGTEGLDTDGDGRYTAEELEPLAAENVSQLREWGYFTVLKADDKRIQFDAVSDYGMTYENGRLSLEMALPLSSPVDPSRSVVTVSSFDPTFYIELVPAEEEAVALDGATDRNCSTQLKRLDANQPSYVPDAVANAANVDPADPENSIGARFAEWITISCSGQP